MSEQAGYRHPGDIEIEHLKFFSATGRVIELAGIVTEVNIFQNIFDHYMRCSIVFSDSTGLFNSLKGWSSGEYKVTGGFTGGELFVISYKSRDDDLKFKKHLFALHSLNDRSRPSEDVEVFSITGISLEAYQTYTNSVSKAYGGTKGNTISKMVESLCKEHFQSERVNQLYEMVSKGTNVTVSKSYTYDNTTGLHKFIIPDYTVDDAIDMFCKEADNDTHIPYYLFYENSAGYQFKDLSNLVKQEVKETFTYKTTNNEEADANEEYTDRTKIIDYNVDRQTDILKNATGGLFSSTMTTVDLLQKIKKDTTFNYDKYASKYVKLQNDNYRLAGSFINGDGVGYLSTTRSGHDASTFFSAEKPITKRIDSFYSAKESYFRHVCNTKVEVTIPGDSEIQVGDCIYLEIPVATNLEDAATDEDKYMSGKYIITELRQQMGSKTGSNFFTTFKCVKDTGIKI
jgi:hypothetical protein